MLRSSAHVENMHSRIPSGDSNAVEKKPFAVEKGFLVLSSLTIVDSSFTTASTNSKVPAVQLSGINTVRDSTISLRNVTAEGGEAAFDYSFNYVNLENDMVRRNSTFSIEGSRFVTRSQSATSAGVGIYLTGESFIFNDANVVTGGDFSVYCFTRRTEVNVPIAYTANLTNSSIANARFVFVAPDARTANNVYPLAVDGIVASIAVTNTTATSYSLGGPLPENSERIYHVSKRNLRFTIDGFAPNTAAANPMPLVLSTYLSTCDGCELRIANGLAAYLKHTSVITDRSIFIVESAQFRIPAPQNSFDTVDDIAITVGCATAFASVCDTKGSSVFVVNNVSTNGLAKFIANFTGQSSLTISGLSVDAMNNLKGITTTSGALWLGLWLRGGAVVTLRDSNIYANARHESVVYLPKFMYDTANCTVNFINNTFVNPNTNERGFDNVGHAIVFPTQQLNPSSLTYRQRNTTVLFSNNFFNISARDAFVLFVDDYDGTNLTHDALNRCGSIGVLSPNLRNDVEPTPTRLEEDPRSCTFTTTLRLPISL